MVVLMDVTPIGVSNGGEDDVIEEGGILDEKGLPDVKTPDSDGESDEIKSEQQQGNDLWMAKCGLLFVGSCGQGCGWKDPYVIRV